MATSTRIRFLNEVLFYKDLIFRVSDSMNDFILTFTIEFSRKSYINTEIPKQWQKNSVR